MSFDLGVSLRSEKSSEPQKAFASLWVWYPVIFAMLEGRAEKFLKY